MEDKIELTPFQYTSYWWVVRMKEFVDNVMRIGASSDEGISFVQLFKHLKDDHWRALYLRLTKLIEEEYIRNGKFIQSTKSTCNDHYVGHGKLNEMLKSIFHVDIPNATLNSKRMLPMVVSIINKNGKPKVFLNNDDCADTIMTEANLNVNKDYILTGDKNLLNKSNSCPL